MVVCIEERVWLTPIATLSLDNVSFPLTLTSTTWLFVSGEESG
jgi:hypothetical protein